jgi:hypothetical protein
MILYRYTFVGAPIFRVLIYFKIERTSGKEKAFP